MSRADGNPDGYRSAYRENGCEVLENGLAVVVLGTPPDERANAHNCDAMGCGWSHVLRRDPIERLADVLAEMGAPAGEGKVRR